MGKSDIVTRLRMDSADYEQKLARAKESTRKFSKDGGQGLTDMMGKFAKLAGAVAASKAAMEVFNGVIKSSQTIGDEYTRVIDSAKSVTNQFFYAIGSGDFRTFNQGLLEMIRNARAATRSLDDLGTNRIVLGYLRDKYSAGFQTALTTARDKSLSEGERKAAAEAANAYVDAYRKSIEQDTSIANNAFQNILKEAGVGFAVDDERIDRVLETYYSLSDAYKEANENLIRLSKAQEGLNAMDAEYRRTWKGQQEVRGYLQEITSINAKIKANKEFYEDAEVFHVFFERWQDETFQTNLKIKQSVEQNRRELAGWENSLNELENQLNQPIKSGTVGDVVYRDITDGVRNALSSQKVAAPTGASASALPVTLEAVQPVILYEKELQTLQDTAVSASEGLGALGNAFGNMSGMLGEGAGAWMNYAGGIVSAVSSALPSLEALAAAQAAAAVTKTALSPWTVISGIAAVTSIIAAMSQIPKFATGGVVPGNALSGDNVLIRANSGEVVLTKQQANNIGSALAGLGGNVRFVIEGDKLVGVLNNHNRITSRSYGR